MGVPGLWEIINKAGRSQALTQLAVVDGFEKNESGLRALRIGIDVSLWYQHASLSKGGAHPEIRMLFFRLLNLSELPFIPLFVFDGRERPPIKRGTKMGKSGSHTMTKDFKVLLDRFGMEWREAPGEAEAELAHLNRKGIIDAVMTDDVDALVFGAKTIIKNLSPMLSGNKNNWPLNSEQQPSKHHAMVCRADDVANHPNIRLTRGGLILFALLSGGDYDSGVKGCGPQLAQALAKCDYGDRLFEAFARRQHNDIRMGLIEWRNEMNEEIRTNHLGRLPRRAPSVIIPSDFPNLQVLKYYAEPVTSATRNASGGPIRDMRDLSIPRIAGFCEEYFVEWGYKSAIIKRFRDLVWPAAVMRVLRRAALEADLEEKNNRMVAGRADLAIRGPLTPSVERGIGTPASLVKRYLDPVLVDRLAEAFVNRGPQVGANITDQNIPDPHPLLVKIVGSRRHVSTDHILEYRLELDPYQFVELTKQGITGSRRDPPLNQHADEEIDNIYTKDDPSQSSPKAPKKAPPDPYSIMRLWLPASIMRQVHPKLVKDFEDANAAKKSGAKKPASPRKRKGKERAREESDEEDEDEPEPVLRPSQQNVPRPRPITRPLQATPPQPIPQPVLQVAPQSVPQPAPQPATQPAPPRTPVVAQVARQEVLRAIEPPAAQFLPLLPIFFQTPLVNRRRKHNEVSVNDPSSLPQRSSGFIFSFPNPDNPDHILLSDEEEEEEETLGPLVYSRGQLEVFPTPPSTSALLRARQEEYLGQTMRVASLDLSSSQPVVHREPDPSPPPLQATSAAPPTPRPSQPKQRQARSRVPTATPPPVASTSTAIPVPAPVPEPVVQEPERPTTRWDMLIDQALGVGDINGFGKGKRTATKPRRRSNVPSNDGPGPSGSQGPRKRRKVSAPAAGDRIASRVPVPSALPPTPTPSQSVRPPEPFPDLPPRRNLSPIRSTFTSTAAESRRRPIPQDRSIISVHSDGDDTYSLVVQPPRRKRKPLRSDGSIISIHSDDEGPGQGSSSTSHVDTGFAFNLNVPGLSQTGGILRDSDDMVIDLT